ncbi:hypothetical protein SECTIM467_158 [Brevibacillus phage SecTim467]|uniref:Uncharacterized protein n=2 Tax=Jenstvirus jenst TaxID=1982225 RepID=A0A0K2CNX6_9CAUD|nr:hypothetical protein AVV11_gp038 [Brevibacillus phage Jenst]ALA07282.1 hypothetical protein JENST_153 [Brevibacillus phage Jenst]ALA07481.1 hypothetical protein SECTIM467_158 [Brevibacillus phage SecTim467]
MRQTLDRTTKKQVQSRSNEFLLKFHVLAHKDRLNYLSPKIEKLIKWSEDEILKRMSK